MKKEVICCKSVFKTGDETTKEAFTSALARVITRIENNKLRKDKDTDAQQIKRSDT